MSGLTTFMYRPDIMALFIPIVAIVVWGIVSIVKTVIRHQERMAMIDRGIHPDHADVYGDGTAEDDMRR